MNKNNDLLDDEECIVDSVEYDDRTDSADNSTTFTINKQGNVKSDNVVMATDQKKVLDAFYSSKARMLLGGIMDLIINNSRRNKKDLN